MAITFDEEKLVWNVFVEDINARKIKIHNIFDHYRFMEDLVNIKKKYGEDFTKFSEEVRKSLKYYYWSKCEWEVVVTSWPPYVDGKEVKRLTEEVTEHTKKYGRFIIRTDVNLDTKTKIDVYDQVMMNWDVFIRYLWIKRELIKKVK